MPMQPIGWPPNDSTKPRCKPKWAWSRLPIARLFGVISRLTEQKGLDLLLTIAEGIPHLPAQLVLLGSGDKAMEAGFKALAERFPVQIAVKLGFDEGLAHRIEAGADSFLMPSRFEPCGLNQMYSLRYGTPPSRSRHRRAGGYRD
jgi:glycogen synthase